MVRRLVLLGFIGAAVVTFYYGVWSNQPLPDHALISGFNDLVLHLAAFACLAAGGLFLWPGKIRLLLVLVVAACAIEIIHSLNPEREANLSDVLASLAGIALGCLAYIAVKRLHALLGNAGTVAENSTSRQELS